jgi:hypothetical protein
VPSLSQDQQPFGLQSLFSAFPLAVFAVCLMFGTLLLVATFLAERRNTGEPSFISYHAARVARSLGRPLWEPLPYHVVLGGLALSLVGWRAITAGGPLRGLGDPLALLGLAVALVGGVMAGALAHPPAQLHLDPDADPEIAHPTPAHRHVSRRLHLGAGPVSAVLIAGSGLAALVIAPVAIMMRLLAGNPSADASPAQAVLLSAVGLMCLGSWALHAEGLHAGPRRSGPRPTTLWSRLTVVLPDAGEVAGAATALLGLSVGIDAGLPPAIAGTAGAVVLLVVRLRARRGSAVGAVAGYLLAWAIAVLATLTFSAPVAPLGWQAVLAAVAVEALALAAGPLRRPRPHRAGQDRVRRSPAAQAAGSAPGSAPAPRDAGWRA